ncbi:MAG: F0F1 ATP synthase subunit gamma [Candidatus Omnitrophica bacterium]|jgi:ATP synthase F1 gamma subunit|nr:F0F1 ATP synthase subunit gamma [Candidatus Omnitrophota bacterium]MDD5691174.1 F0F1 ATP synthase subunit gamma [Candidatus Omnitrophota bacterium]
MIPLVILRKDLAFNKVMESIIEVLKGVAATEYFHLQSKRKSFDEFEGYLRDLFERVDISGFQHPFLGGPASSSNIVMITSDSGFLGELNMSVVNYGLAQYRSDDLLTVVGKEGVRYIGEQGIKYTSFAGIDDDISYSTVIKLRDHIVNEFFNKKLSSTVIVYPHFVSFAVQKIEQFQLFPCRFLFPQESGSGKTGLGQAGFLQIDPSEKVILDSPLKSIVEYLVKVWVGQLIHLIFWESKLSEWAARVMHLERSSNEIRDQQKKMRLQYFRTMHERSDKSTREIFVSRMALRKTGAIA